MKFKHLQLWLHNHYELVRFWVAMITAFFVVIVLLGVIQSNNQASKNRQEQLKRSIAAQSRLISCLLAIHGSGLQITNEDEARCRITAQQQLNSDRTQADESPPTSSAVSKSPTPSTPQTPPQSPPPTNPPPNPPETGLVEQVVTGVRKAAGSAIRWIESSP